MDIQVDRFIDSLQNDFAEQGVIGAIGLGGDIGQVAAIIGTDKKAFCVPQRGQIYEALLHMHNNGCEASYAFIYQHFRDRGMSHQEAIGDIYDEWTTCMAVASCPENAPSYARLVRDLYERRKLVTIAQKLAADADGRDAMSEILARLLREARELSTTTDCGTNAADLVARIVEQTCAKPIKTGIVALDNLANGLPASSLIIVGARPSIGKTSLGIQTALNAAVAEGISTFFVSAEMSKLEIIKRIASLMTGLPYSEFGSDVLSNPDKCDPIKWKLQDVEMRLGGARLQICDTSHNIAEVIERTRAHHRQYGLRLLVVDYLQLLVPAEKHENRNLAVASMSAALKRLAVETGAAVLCLSQLSRNADKTNSPPTLSDLRDSGAIEQDADMVWLMYRSKDAYDAQNNSVGLIVAKNRNGPTGAVKLFFNGLTMRFSCGEHAR